MNTPHYEDKASPESGLNLLQLAVSLAYVYLLFEVCYFQWFVLKYGQVRNYLIMVKGIEKLGCQKWIKSVTVDTLRWSLSTSGSFRKPTRKRLAAVAQLLASHTELLGHWRVGRAACRLVLVLGRIEVAIDVLLQSELYVGEKSKAVT